jgi:hypothetical protein
MSDISNTRRTFVAFFNCNHAGSDGHYIEQVIEAGEDADVIMAEVLDDLVGSNSESSWYEPDVDEYKKLKRNKHI